jgi:hypothetical protein
MHKVAEFRKIANALRAVAGTEPADENHSHLLAVAEEWEAMARQRELLLLAIRAGTAFIATRSNASSDVKPQ